MSANIPNQINLKQLRFSAKQFNSLVISFVFHVLSSHVLMFCFHKIAQKFQLDLILESPGEEYRDKGEKQPLVGITQVWVLKMSLKGDVF